MNKIGYIIGFLLILVSAGAFAQNTAADETVTVPFGKMSDRRIVSSVTRIDMEDWQDKLVDNSWKTILNNDGFGMFGTSDIRGDKYIIMVDGLIRDGSSSVSSFTDMMNSEQIESITILKDAASRMLYGAYADKGIIMITTKRGHIGKRKINVYYESDFGVPVSLPSYMKTSDYMILYNEARANDGLSPMYSYDQIEAARSGSDPLQYPMQDYYGSGDFLNAFKPQHKVSLDFSGGNERAKYYLNVGYYNTSSIIKNSNQSTNRFNVRGNVDVNLNKWVNVSLGAAAIFNSYKGPNYLGKNFWGISTSERINSYPLLIPIDRIREEDMGLVEEAMAQRSVIDDKWLVGGSKIFTQNLYGDLMLGGYTNTMDRMAQINVGLNVDFGFLTKGMYFKSYFGSDNYNVYTTAQKNKYAVYEPAFLEDGTIAITKVGANDFVGSQAISGVAFYRRLGWTNVLGYDRVFADKHDLSVALTSVMHNYKESNSAYANRSANFGVRANYMFDRKYVVEYSGALIGTSRFAKGHRWGYAQSAGAGWIISENSFMQDAHWMDYLKLKASYALSKTDIDNTLSSYYLYDDTYLADGSFSYGDGAGSNGEMSVTKGNPNLGWIRKHDINVGLEAMMFDRQLSLYLNYYHTLRFDEPVRRSSTRPSYIGGSAFLPFENFGSRSVDGVELKLGWDRTFGDFSVNLVGSVIWYSPKLVNYDEVDYGEGMEYRQHAGKASDAIWGFVSDGLYTQQEIDAINDINNTDVVRPTYGSVQAGDVKYRDMNGDKVIDNYDLTVIGNTHARFNYGLQVNLKYRNFGLYMYLFAKSGVSKLFQDNYYNVFGEKKYPEHLKGRWAYDPEHGIDTRATATYPRLTTLQNTNNFKESTYWLADTGYFAIPDIQLTYSFGKRVLSALHLNGLSVFVKASDTLLVGPNADKIRLNVGSEPQYRKFSVGMNIRF